MIKISIFSEDANGDMHYIGWINWDSMSPPRIGDHIDGAFRGLSAANDVPTGETNGHNSSVPVLDRVKVVGKVTNVCWTTENNIIIDLEND